MTRSNGIQEDFNGFWFDDVIAIQLQNEFTGAGQDGLIRGSADPGVWGTSDVDLRILSVSLAQNRQRLIA